MATESTPANSENVPGPYTCHCLVARQMARQLTRAYDRRLRPAGISVGDFSILQFLSPGEGMTMADLGASLFMERTTLVRNLRPLTAAGLVETSRDPQESRRHMVAITATGRRKLSEAAALWSQAQEEFEAAAGAAEADEIRRRSLAALGLMQD